MAYSNKCTYTQADGALTNSYQAVTFSEDGGSTTFQPNAIIIKNDDTTGNNTVIVQINSATTEGNYTIKAGKGLTYSIKKVKHLAVKYGTGAPDFTISGVR